MPIEIPATAGRPAQWRYSQTPGSNDRGAFPLGVGVQQHTNTRLIRIFIQFDYGRNFPQSQRANYPETADAEPGESQAWASRWVDRRELLDALGFPRPGERRAPGALRNPPNLPRVLETLIWGPNHVGWIGKLSSVTIANG